MVILHR